MASSIDKKRLELNSYPVQLTIETQFSDTDVVGHLNNVAIARLYENARARFHLFTMGNSPFGNTTDGSDVIVEVNIKYMGEGFFPESVVVGTNIAKVGRSSYIMQQGMFQKDKCIGLCEAVFVYVEGGASCELSDERRKALMEYSK